jgi:transposase
MQAEALLDGVKAHIVVTHNAYDADSLVERITASGAKVVIPRCSNRHSPRPHYRHPYKNRNVIERFFNRLKQFRRIATRYDELARNYCAFTALVSTLI